MQNYQSIKESLINLEKEIQEKISSIIDVEHLKELYQDILGKKGRITEI
jgi:hypothetical protein